MGFIAVLVYAYLKLYELLTFTQYYFLVLILLVVIALVERGIINRWGIKQFKKII
ncbi:hypothetical protein D3C81_2280450 [compost metagenome]